MINSINDGLKIESEIPFFKISSFEFEWKPNCHAILQISGYIDINDVCEIEMLYGSKIKIIQLIQSEWKPIFWGYITYVIQKKVGSVMLMSLKILSTTCMLDLKSGQKTFQKTEKTYADIIEEVVKNSGGQVICTEGNSEIIGKPLIQYQESTWDFCKRVCSYIGGCIIADITNERPSLWFGMRKGEYIQGVQEITYNICIKCLSQEDQEPTYEVESRCFYRIGDIISFNGDNLIVCSVRASFEHGELIYGYVLKKTVNCERMLYNELYAGIGFRGTITDVQGESVKIALDIDKDADEGEYLYEWYPETGNGMYAMPEIGAKAILFIPCHDERRGFVVHCLQGETQRGEPCNKYCTDSRGQTFHIFMDHVNLYKGTKHSLSIEDKYIKTDCIENISIVSKDRIRIVASKIFIESLDKVDICQG